MANVDETEKPIGDKLDAILPKSRVKDIKDNFMLYIVFVLFALVIWQNSKNDKLQAKLDAEYQKREAAKDKIIEEKDEENKAWRLIRQRTIEQDQITRELEERATQQESQPPPNLKKNAK